MGSDNIDSWRIDQITKSEFFHQKLHEYGLLEIAYNIEDVRGEKFDWDKKCLGISEDAWEKVIHRGIKPVRVFAHPQILTSIERSVGYYQKLALVSLKSMSNVGLDITGYETGKNKRPMKHEKAENVARHLNNLISHLIESDDQIDPREFDLWRGMTAGSSAQGSWQNTKGDRMEQVVKGMITRRIQDRDLLLNKSKDGKKLELTDGRIVEYNSEPDFAFYDEDHNIVIAVEIKGGIDTAGVLERIGAAIKSLDRAKQKNKNSITILIIPKVSMTEQAEHELEVHKNDIDYWFALEDLLNQDAKKQEIFSILGI